MNAHDEKPVTFSRVFTRINDMYPRKIIDVKGEIVFPVDERTAFMFKNLLPQGAQSYHFIHEPEEVFRDISDNRRRELRRKARQESGVDFVFLQTEKRSIFTNSQIPLTEELVELMTMLFFRSQGYMVQRPLGTYMGVDDVIAWKSPLTEKLRAHRLIEYGCFVDELGLLRKFGRVNQIREEKSIHNELVLVEAESSIRKAIANDSGMNQLLGKEWGESNPQKYREGAKQRIVANKLFITFPVCFPTWFPSVDSFEEVVREFDRRQLDQRKIGIVCWEPTTYYFKDSAEFQHDKMTEELSKYEAYAKQLLLKNFYFDELLSLMQELKIELKGRTKDEVFVELEKKVREGDVDILISKLDRVLT